jgi:hypothetical protein
MHQMRISTTQVTSVMLRSKKLEIRKKKWKSRRKKAKQRHEINPNPSKDRAMPEGDNPSFWDEFIKFTSMHIRILKQVPKYLATGLYRPSGNISPPAKASTQGLKCKTNTLPILIHQMRISTTQINNWQNVDYRYDIDTFGYMYN